MPLRGMHPGIILLCASACAKPSAPTAVRAEPIHPELQCPAGTLAMGAVPPAGREAWCTQAGMRTGPSLTWHDNGQKASQGAWTADQRTGPWLYWHANGQLAEQGSYAGGVKEGVWTTFDPLGHRLSEGAWVSGGRDGSWMFWDPEAQTRTEAQYVLGSREGTWIEYSPEGTALRRWTYRDDRQLDMQSLR